MAASSPLWLFLLMGIAGLVILAIIVVIGVAIAGSSKQEGGGKGGAVAAVVLLGGMTLCLAGGAVAYFFIAAEPAETDMFEPLEPATLVTDEATAEEPEPRDAATEPSQD